MPGTNLTRTEARERAAIIQTHHYDVELDLTQGPKIFTAATTVTFDATTPGESTFIDLIADHVRSIELNGESLDPAEYFSDSRITLPNLQSTNTLMVLSDQAYTNTGEGLHRFVDPVDGEIYLYSQFEVPDSRRMYPVFEQPDLKATFTFTVTAPARWKVVSNQPTPDPTPSGYAGDHSDRPGEEIATWKFGPTPIMSSYITALVCGPYAEARSQLTSLDGRTIPLGVFCRESLFEYLDADYIFEKTRQGFEFFEKEFDYPYPFDKYDQLFVPEFNMGAMENIGAVTHTEAYVFRGQVTDAMRERRVVTILHELAHMWFGDLVTMKWWNDLWLNESFAEFMSTLATAEATEWTDCWTTFAASEKTWAYRQDQLPSTHPIVAEIRDLDDILANFDGITYAKGASVLKALVAYVGRDAFMRGVHAYFMKHAYKNTELSDLITELETAGGRDLTDWINRWLTTAGVNTLRAEFDLAPDGTYSQFAIRQTATHEYPTLRPHRIAIGSYNLENGKLVRTSRIEVDIAAVAISEISELVGQQQPDLLLINDDDLSYAKIRLDNRSMETVTDHLRDIDDSLTRTLLWGALWDQTRDGELAASKFIDMVDLHLGREDASTTLRTVLSQVRSCAQLYVDQAQRDTESVRTADVLWKLAAQAQPGSDAQFQFVTAFAGLAQTQEQLGRVQGLYTGGSSLEGLTVDQDLKWVLLASLAAGNRATGSDIETELAHDDTASGRQAAARARAAIATPEAKLAAWKSAFEDSSAPNLIVRYTGIGFSQVHDPSLLVPFVEPYFASLRNVWETRSYAITEELVEGFFPLELANTEIRDKAEAWLSTNADAPAPLRRMIVESLAGVERALIAQQTDNNAR
ncbi:MAG: aminopeptidase N [Canibacter sp.]